MKSSSFKLALALLLVLPVSSAAALEELADEQLEAISARGFDFRLNGSSFAFARSQGGVSGAGSVDMASAGGSLHLSSVALSANAQQNLRALINTIAVNSQVQIMLNLTVNVNSSTGPIRQINHGFINF